MSARAHRRPPRRAGLVAMMAIAVLTAGCRSNAATTGTAPAGSVQRIEPAG